MLAMPSLLRLQLWLLRQSAPVLAAGLMCATGVLLWLLLAIEYQQRARQAATGLLRQSEAHIAHAPASRQQPGPEAFRAALGELPETTRLLQPVFTLAAKSGVEIARGDYQLLPDADGGFHVYRATLPLTGSYRAVREFSEQLLLALPFMSIDQLSLQRAHAGEAVLNARLSIAFYLTGRPGTRR